jgi:ubiquinone/menaquinone biosynthesis C-methylase UbiE
MISQARMLNGDIRNCEFIFGKPGHIPVPDGAFDFVYSLIVLQHLRSKEEILGYISEFCRVLRPGGTLVFQLPDVPGLRRRMIRVTKRLWPLFRRLGLGDGVLHRRFGLSPAIMNGLNPDKVKETLSASGISALHVQPDDMTGPHYRSYTYFGKKGGS